MYSNTAELSDSGIITKHSERITHLVSQSAWKISERCHRIWDALELTATMEFQHVIDNKTVLYFEKSLGLLPPRLRMIIHPC